MESNFSPQLYQQEHFHWGQVGVIALCAVFLIGITFMRNGLRLSPVPASTEAQSQLTYEQAQAQVIAENPNLSLLANASAAEVGPNSPTQQQLALVDSGSSSGGAVLGASTSADGSNLELAGTDSGIQGSISINALGYTNSDVVRQYVSKVSSIETRYNSLTLLANLTSTDTAQVQENQNAIPLLLTDLSRVPVPSDLENYQKLKISYYTVLEEIGQIQLGQASGDQLSSLASSLFSINDQMDGMRNDFQAKYQITLP